MTRAILFSVFVGIIFAGFEGATDAAGPGFEGNQVNGHEVHGSAHIDSHEHDIDGHKHDGDDHFCHCSVHALALLTALVSSATEEKSVSSSRYDDQFSSLVEPPLLRPPNS
jgi:hypothetical protein